MSSQREMVEFLDIERDKILGFNLDCLENEKKISEEGIGFKRAYLLILVIYNNPHEEFTFENIRDKMREKMEGYIT